MEDMPWFPLRKQKWGGREEDIERRWDKEDNKYKKENKKKKKHISATTCHLCEEGQIAKNKFLAFNNQR